jgi:tellurite resistance protein TerC
MGLRALYFLLAGVMGMFRYLHYGLSAILVFIGTKMLLHGFVHINPVVSLAVILSLLAVSVIASLIAARREVAEAIEHADEATPTPEATGE